MNSERLKEEFPVDWEEDDYVTRREFFRFVTLASGGLAIGSGALAAMARFSRDSRDLERVLVAKASEIPVGQTKSFNYPREHDLCILIHAKEGEFVAFSQRCTHLSCPVTYQHDKQRLYCPCHNGAFSLADGTVMQGPPPRPLPRIQLQQEGDEIYAVGVARAGQA
jgi:nitrite reductase/ring-hydroxylating ferredoxin subunit